MWNQIVTAIRNLQPQTVVALENVPFLEKAKALPDVEAASCSIDDVFMTGDSSGRIIDANEAMCITPDIEERMVVMGSCVIYGGLAYDHTGGFDPLEEGSANGNIYHASTRRGDADQVAAYNEALGLDADGNKDLSCQSVRDRLVQRVMKGIGNDLGVFTRMLKMLQDQGKPLSKASMQTLIEFCIDQEGWKFALDYLADSLFGVAYWHRLDDDVRERFAVLEDLFSEAAVEACWEEASEAGEVGNPLAVVLDIYEHSGIAYSVSGSGMNCRWDTSRGAAVWVPDQDAVDNIRSSVFKDLGIGKVALFGAVGSKHDQIHARYTLDGSTWVGEGKGWSWKEAQDQMIAASLTPIDQIQLQSFMYAKAEEYCKGVLEEYNDWVNGNVYGVVCYVVDRETGDILHDESEECWGYLGCDGAEQELEAMILAKVIRYAQTRH